MSEASSNPAPRKHRGYRGAHRSLSHDESHAQGHNAAAPPPLPDHPLVCKDEPELVASAEGLRALVDELRHFRRFAYDSEFIGEQSYFPKLCLIQVATPARMALIDPLAGLDLRPFWELLADEGVEKIVHAGEQDLEPVPRNIGRPAVNVFDAQIAAGFAGQPFPLALGKLVAACVAGADVGHNTKFSIWDQRPLTPAQLRYAANDVRFLPAAREHLMAKLREFGTLEWALNECAAQAAAAAQPGDGKAQKVRVRGVASLSPRHLTVLKALSQWRDGAARSLDLPPRSLIRDDVLVEMARRPVKTVRDLTKVRGLPRPVERDYGRAIVEATQVGLDAPITESPTRREFETPEEKDRVTAVMEKVQAHSRERSVDPMLVTSRKEMTRVVRAIEAGRPVEAAVLQGWRRELLGDLIERATAEGRANPPV